MRSGVLVVFGVAIASSSTHAAPQREGRITIARNSRSSGSSVEAVFADSPISGVEIVGDGRCSLRKDIPIVGLSAGALAITGTAAPITLRDLPTKQGVVYHREGSLPAPAYVDHAEITVEASGGADVPAFTAKVVAPFQLAGYKAPSSLSRDGYTATWTPAAGSEIEIHIVAFDARARKNLSIVCRVPDTGTFTVPRSAFAWLPPSFDRALLMVGRVAETVEMVGDVRVMIDVVSTAGRIPGMPLGLATSVEHSPTTPRFFATLGFEPVGSWRLQLGQRFARNFQVVEEISSIGSDYGFGLPADTTEEHYSFGVGVRWMSPIPRKRLPFVPYLTAIVGAEVRDRVSETAPGMFTDDAAWAPMASLAAGLFELGGRDWLVGPEFRVQVARFDGRMQHEWQSLLTIQLNAW